MSAQVSTTATTTPGTMSLTAKPHLDHDMNSGTAKTTPYNSLKQGILQSPTNASALEKLKDKDEKVEDVERHAGNDLSQS